MASNGGDSRVKYFDGLVAEKDGRDLSVNVCNYRRNTTSTYPYKIIYADY